MLYTWAGEGDDVSAENTAVDRDCVGESSLGAHLEHILDVFKVARHEVVGVDPVDRLEHALALGKHVAPFELRVR